MVRWRQNTIHGRFQARNISSVYTKQRYGVFILCVVRRFYFIFDIKIGDINIINIKHSITINGGYLLCRIFNENSKIRLGLGCGVNPLCTTSCILNINLFFKKTFRPRDCQPEGRATPVYETYSIRQLFHTRDIFTRNRKAITGTQPVRCREIFACISP